MDIKKTLVHFFSTYGERFSIKDCEGDFRGVLSAASTTESPKAEAEPLGLGLSGSFRLMTKPDIPVLVKGASLLLGGDWYFVEAVEDYRLADLVIYRQAILRRLRERMVDSHGSTDGV